MSDFKGSRQEGPSPLRPSYISETEILRFTWKRRLRTCGLVLIVLIFGAHLIKALAGRYAVPQVYEYAVFGIPGRFLDLLDDARTAAGFQFGRLTGLCPPQIQDYCVDVNRFSKQVLGID